MSSLRDACGLSHPGDPAILAFAAHERRVLVTLDNDFGQLAVLHRPSHAGIIRIIEQSVRHHVAMVQKVIDENEESLRDGAIIVVEADRTRVHVHAPDA